MTERLRRTLLVLGALAITLPLWLLVRNGYPPEGCTSQESYLAIGAANTLASIVILFVALGRRPYRPLLLPVAGTAFIIGTWAAGMAAEGCFID